MTAADAFSIFRPFAVSWQLGSIFLGNHDLCGLLEESAHEKSPKCLGGNLGDFGEFCKGLGLSIIY